MIEFGVVGFFIAIVLGLLIFGRRSGVDSERAKQAEDALDAVDDAAEIRRDVADMSADDVERELRKYRR